MLGLSALNGTEHKLAEKVLADNGVKKGDYSVIVAGLTHGWHTANLPGYRREAHQSRGLHSSPRGAHPSRDATTGRSARLLPAGKGRL